MTTSSKGAGGDPAGSGKAHGEVVPAGYVSRIEAITDVIRFGPESLTDAEFKTLLFHVERTVPYGKSSDSTSLSQMADGVFNRTSNQWIRAGCGLKPSAIKKANAALIRKGLLKKRRVANGGRGNLPTRYTIQWPELKQFFEEFKRGKSVEPLSHDVAKDSHQTTKARPPRGQPLSHQMANPLATTWPHRGDITEVIITEEISQKKSHQNVKLDTLVGPSGEHQRRNDFSKPFFGDDDDRKTLSSGEPDFEMVETDPGSGLYLKRARNKSKTPRYKTPEDELQAHVQQETGKALTLDVILRVAETLELRGVPLQEFVEDVKNNHNVKACREPAAFLTKHAKAFGVRTRRPQPEIDTSPEKCEKCHGTGGIDRSPFVPCECEHGQAAREHYRRLSERQQVSTESIQ